MKKMELCVQSRSSRVGHYLIATFKAQSKELYKQFRIILRALRHPDVPWYSKVVCGCAVAYLASPIQLIPSFIPIIGQMDDVLVIALSIKLLKRSAPSLFVETFPKVEEMPESIGRGSIEANEYLGSSNILGQAQDRAA